MGRNTGLKTVYFNLNPLNLCMCISSNTCAGDVLNRQICHQSTFTLRTEFLIPLPPIGCFLFMSMCSE